MGSNRTLENRTLASSPELSVEIVEVRNIQENNPNGYEISLVGKNLEERKISIGPDGKNFVRGLLREDKLLVIMNWEKCVAVYGLLEKDKFYTF